MSSRRAHTITLAAVLTMLLTPYVNAQERIHARLSGYSEVPAISTTGTGDFTAKISRDETEFEFELTYENLEGTLTTAAHIHLGQPNVNGGVDGDVFLPVHERVPHQKNTQKLFSCLTAPAHLRRRASAQPVVNNAEQRSAHAMSRAVALPTRYTGSPRAG